MSTAVPMPPYPLIAIDVQKRVSDALPALSKALGNARIEEVSVTATGAVHLHLQVNPVVAMLGIDPNEPDPFEL